MKIKNQKSNIKNYRLILFCISALLCFCALSYSQDINQMVAEGNRLIKEGKYDEAAKVLLQAKKADEKSPLPDVALGMMFLQKNSLWEAETHLKAAEELDPELAAVQYTLALLYEKKGEKETAIDYWNKLLNKPDFETIARKHLQFLGGVK